jgi:hypothetical protein
VPTEMGHGGPGVYGVGVRGGGGRGDREGREREIETRGYEPLALHAAMHLAIFVGSVRSVRQRLTLGGRSLMRQIHRDRAVGMRITCQLAFGGQVGS